MTVAETIHEAEALCLELERRRSGKTRWCPHSPTAKQRVFLQMDVDECLYGGAAGGGKSDALLMAALEHVDQPNYSAILFRRTYADLALPGAIMDRAFEWLSATPAVWNGTKKQWRFPSGAVLTFGYLDTDRDKFRYQSAEFQYVGFDELTQFPEGSYKYLFSRLRRGADSKVPLRMRAATNPGGVGHEWVKRRFIDGVVPFVSARLDDNPHADKESYLQSLAKLDSITRDQLEKGLWVQDSTGLVYRSFAERNIIAALPSGVAEWHFMLGIDFGFHDACAFVTLAYRDGDPVVYVVASHKQTGMSPSDAGEYVESLRWKFSRIIGDEGGLGKGYAEEMRRRFRIPVEPAEKVNKHGYIDLLNGDFERKQVVIVREGNEALIEELYALPWNETRTKEADSFDNHLADALLYVWRASTTYLTKPKPDTRPQPVKDAEAFAKARYEQFKKHHDRPRVSSYIDPVFDEVGYD